MKKQQAELKRQKPLRFFPKVTVLQYAAEVLYVYFAFHLMD